MCDPATRDCEHLDVDTAALLDYLVRLDRWARFSWELCKEAP